MFSIGEYVVYGVEGVCRVEEAGKLKVAGLDKNRAYYRAILSGHDCVALLRLCKTLHAKQNSPSASRRGVNSTELRSWRMAEEMLYGEFGFALGLPPAQVRDYLREKLGG